jgi:hypothetical protein
LLTNTHTFTGSLQVTASTINLNSSKTIIGDDGTYSGNYNTIGFGGTTNGFNRIFASTTTADGLFLVAATGRGIYFRPAAKGSNDVNMLPNGNVGLGVNFILPTATLHISGSGSGSLMQISSTVSSSIFFVSGSGNIGIGTITPSSILDVRTGAGTSGNILNLNNTTGASVSNIVPIRFFAGNTFGGLEQIAAVWGINPNAGANNGGALVFATSADGTATSPTERMRITSGGNVGIGTTPTTGNRFWVSGSSASSSDSSLIVQNSTGAYLLYTRNDGNIGIGTNTPAYALDISGSGFGLNLSGGNNRIYFGAYRALEGSTTGTTLQVGEGYRLIQLQTIAGTSVLNVSSSSKVGIGTTTPDTKLHIYDGTNPLSIKLQRTSVPVFFSDVQTAGTTAGAVWSHNIENTSNGSFTWSGLTNTSYAGSAIILNSDTATSYTTFHTANSANTAPTERMRITGPGNLLVGQSTPDLGANGWQLQGVGGGHTAFQVTNNEAFIFNNRTTGTTFQIDFRTNGVERGSINVTDASTSYATTSDYRIKEDFKDFNGLEKLTNIKVYDFKFKDLDERMDGVIAHELQEVLPYAVYGEKDGVKFQSVDYSKLVPVLVKSIQELSTKLDEATTRIKTLESK